MPYFSVVIPLYNRARQIGRALDSCLAQTFGDFEVIVVDDASTDDSVAAVRRYTDLRIKLLGHGRNRGVCPARNTGVLAASGAWVVFLDSDDEFLPHALETMHRRAQEVTGEITRMVFMYRLDNGEASPQPSLTAQVWDYAGYLCWSEALIGSSDFNNCIRRETFTTVGLPQDRAFEAFYHLEFARHFKTHAFPEVVALVHGDAENRTFRSSLESLVSTALDNARSLEHLVEKHGTAMSDYCPRRLYLTLRATAVQYFISGQRFRGWRQLIRLVQLRPFAANAWSLFLVGCLGRHVVARLFLWRQSILALNLGPPAGPDRE